MMQGAAGPKGFGGPDGRKGEVVSIPFDGILMFNICIYKPIITVSEGNTRRY